MDLILDTCSFLWLALNPGKIPPGACEALNDTSNQRMLSMVSVLEIVLKYRMDQLPLTEAVIYESRHLPGNHADPFDRLIAAQARVLNCPVLTSDTWIGKLGANVMWT